MIDVKTAETVGFIRDIDIDVETGKIRSVTIPQKGIFGAFLNGKDITVPWESVVAIGSEFVIIKQEENI